MRDIDRCYRRFRAQEVMTMTVVYAIFYVCRLAFSAAKKDMIEQGLYTAEEVGWVGSSMLIAYAIGKCVNGFIADRANITCFMGLGLLASAFVNFLVGFHLPALVLIALTSWAVWMIALSGAFFAMSRYAIIDWGIFFLQVKKGYSATTAATIIAVNSIVGGFAGAASGWVSDRFFKGNRNGLALAFGVMNVASLCLFMLVPGHHPWLDILAMCLFGIAMGILLCYLGGLMAVDLVPRKAAGAAMGVVAVLTYVGAAVQSRVSVLFIETSAEGERMASRFLTTTIGGWEVDRIAIFWIGMAVLSVLCALSVWKARD